MIRIYQLMILTITLSTNLMSVWTCLRIRFSMGLNVHK